MLAFHKIQFKIVLLALLVLSHTSSLYAKKIQAHTAYNGTIFIYQASTPTPLSYNNGKKSLHYMPHPSKEGEFVAFIPIGYYDKGVKTLHNPKQIESITQSITILQKDYPKKEQINVANNKVSYSNEVAKRIEKEKNAAIKTYATITKGRLWDKPFIKPLDSVITSPYGSARIFNGKVNSYHGGTDLRAAIGTPILATNDGRVALVQDRYLSGKSIYIDHGSGVYSVYFHLDEFLVKQGDMVKQGQVIAKSGDTGRVSGAHLHFGIVINGTNVDAMDFIEQVNALF
ncbi:peptidase M23 [Helicobacter cinaedi]|uniref:M23 family metallopeptidase n=1 Tax=Helicobacter cinaedi TaxID=213 RepID=UPI001F184F87|nr:M23 family metallopeptidase [Helicobacter cinaedi]BDB64726.1 peptidase M23 [Helicobacter cinaedi]